MKMSRHLREKIHVSKFLCTLDQQLQTRANSYRIYHKSQENNVIKSVRDLNEAYQGGVKGCRN